MVQQIENNTRDQIMLGDYPDALRDAIMDSVDSHNGMAGRLLRDPELRREFALLLLNAIFQERSGQSTLRKNR